MRVRESHPASFLRGRAARRWVKRRDRVPRAYLKYYVTSLVCQSTGGFEMYTGRGMKESHQHLDITEKEWQAMGHEKGRLPANFLPAGSIHP